MFTPDKKHTESHFKKVVLSYIDSLPHITPTCSVSSLWRCPPACPTCSADSVAGVDSGHIQILSLDTRDAHHTHHMSHHAPHQLFKFPFFFFRLSRFAHATTNTAPITIFSLHDTSVLSTSMYIYYVFFSSPFISHPIHPFVFRVILWVFFVSCLVS